MGRPSGYSDELADRICELISGGKSVKSICEMQGMPSMQSVWKWIREQPKFAENYARATAERADAVFEEMFSIADDGSNDTYVDEEGKEKTDHDVIARSKLRIDTRKWALSRMNPRKYGDKVEQVHSGAVEVTQITRRVVDAQNK